MYHAYLTCKKFNTYDPNLMHSTPGIRTDLFPRPMTETLVTDFFGGVAHAEITRQRYPLAVKPLVHRFDPKNSELLL